MMIRLIDNELDQIRTFPYEPDFQTACTTIHSVQWCRLKGKRWILIRNDPRSNDIVQGKLGNCWLLSALVLVVQNERLLAKILLTTSAQFKNDSRALVRLFYNGIWHVIPVDDWFPCDLQGDLLFAKAKRNQLFVPVIEKAIAKMYGGYDQLAGGHISQALTLLTGFPCEVFCLPEQFNRNARQYWLKMISYNSARFLMAVSCGRTDCQSMGLLADHAYSVLDVVSMADLRLVKLRNPWGRRVWNGDWSQQSSRWTWKLHRILKTKGSSEDGIFWISFEDLCKYFDNVIVCKIQPDWFQYAFQGALPLYLNDSNHHHGHQGVVFEIWLEPDHVAKKGYAQLMVSLFKMNQPHQQQQQQQPNDTSIVVFLFQLLSWQTSYILGDFIGCSVCSNQCSVTCEAEIQQGRRYLLVAFAFDQQTYPIATEYVLRIYSSRPLRIEPNYEPNPALKGDLLIHYALNCGKSFKKTRNIVSYHLDRNWPGLISMVENHHHKKWLKVTMKYQEHKSCDKLMTSMKYSSRQCNETEDIIPPRHCQIINVITDGSIQHDKSISVSMKFRFKPPMGMNQSRHQPNINNRYGLHSVRSIIKIR